MYNLFGSSLKVKRLNMGPAADKSCDQFPEPLADPGFAGKVHVAAAIEKCVWPALARYPAGPENPPGWPGSMGSSSQKPNGRARTEAPQEYIE